MAKARCYAMYGLIGGPFPYGLYYSRGLDVLAEKLRKLDPNVEVPPSFGFSQWRAIVADIGKQPNETRVVIFGHSMGANQALAAAVALGKRRVDLIAAFDPTMWYPVEALGANVARALWFRGTSILSPFGHGRLKAGAGFNGKLERFDVSDRHETIDDNEKLHAIVLDAVRALLV
jgi:pimeloyl-ACP methyl ester carboxylesterase